MTASREKLTTLMRDRTHCASEQLTYRPNFRRLEGALARAVTQFLPLAVADFQAPSSAHFFWFAQVRARQRHSLRSTQCLRSIHRIINPPDTP
jgi:hypothetical protein